eukprot:CAMPEP_0194266088 /NCGR_PEP_ID=MMETSP0169-20130528/1113_1 /TAXON_ID=218684 /ORGANISM="Corethron pennatum, Strain L29A3" /LENGTH=554 /DNA_ID=CAMNT_0039006693 /DNA_START=39 /DNA_END=1703 /DNA_ORIENTATION=+
MIALLASLRHRRTLTLILSTASFVSPLISTPLHNLMKSPYRHALAASAAPTEGGDTSRPKPRRRRRGGRGKGNPGSDSRERMSPSNSPPQGDGLGLTPGGPDGKVSVAIIGGGVAGLSCARHLCDSGDFRCTVFDTGRLRAGGRCSSRIPVSRGDEDTPLARLGYPVDHAAQILSVSDEEGDWARQVAAWQEEGSVVAFPPGGVAEVSADGIIEVAAPAGTKMYRGSAEGGMGAIPLSLLRQAQNLGAIIEQDVWVSPNGGVRREVDGWTVKGKGRTKEKFDRLVVAHNGKCADRLMSKTPAKGLHSLLRTDFRNKIPDHGGKRMTLNSIYSLTVLLETGGAEQSAIAEALRSTTRGDTAVADGIMSLFIKNHPSLRFVTCATRKYGQDDKDDRAEVWTVLSSPTFATKYKGPQENLPLETVQNVTNLLLRATEKSLGLDEGRIRPIDSRLQLWGAAVPLNVWTGKGDVDGFLYDHEFGAGCCGDWLVEPSIRGAWESGRRLAQWMAKAEETELGKALESLNVGLPGNGGHFVASKWVAEDGIGAHGSEEGASK